MVWIHIGLSQCRTGPYKTIHRSFQPVESARNPTWWFKCCHNFIANSQKIDDDNNNDNIWGDLLRSVPFICV